MVDLADEIYIQFNNGGPCLIFMQSNLSQRIIVQLKFEFQSDFLVDFKFGQLQFNKTKEYENEKETEEDCKYRKFWF